MPGAGHVVHMPAHVYLRVGRYEDAARANIAAVEADNRYFAARTAARDLPDVLRAAQPALPVGDLPAVGSAGESADGGAGACRIASLWTTRSKRPRSKGSCRRRS